MAKAAITFGRRDWPKPIKANAEGASKQDVFQTLIPGEEWQLVSSGHRATDGPSVNDKGELIVNGRTAVASSGTGLT